MELWFWAAVASALFSGIGNFLLKSAAHRGYSSEVFILIGGFVSIALTLPIALFFYGVEGIVWIAMLVAWVGGFIAAGGGIAKVYALRHIDTTIFFPLFKLISPTLAILFGIIFFRETFSAHEWIGLMLGVTVPLLLITRAENSRQNNLTAGLVLVLLVGALSAGAAALNKFATDLWPNVFWILVFASLGVFCGSVVLIIKKDGWRTLRAIIRKEATFFVVWLGSIRAVLMCISTGAGLFAFTVGGTLAVVHTIQSLYILVPIILAIIFYKEHWNTQKVLAVVLSIAALALLR